MNKLAFPDVKSIEDKLGDYLELAEKGIEPITIPGLARRLGVTKKKLLEYGRGLVATAPPEVTAKLQDILLLVNEDLELRLLGERGEKGTGANPKFLLANYYGMSDKTSVEVDGGLSIYAKIEEDADRLVADTKDELEREIQETIKGGK